MLKIGDSVRFKLAYYNSKRKITKETGIVLEGIAREVSDVGLLIAVSGESLPYFVTHDRVVDSLKVDGAG